MSARLKQILSRTLLTLLAASAALYLGDWAIWRARVAAGNGMGTVSIGVVVESPLKNGREEYDWAGVQPVDCTHSLFPHADDDACWWLARQKAYEEK